MNNISDLFYFDLAPISFIFIYERLGAAGSWLRSNGSRGVVRRRQLFFAPKGARYCHYFLPSINSAQPVIHLRAYSMWARIHVQ